MDVVGEQAAVAFEPCASKNGPPDVLVSRGKPIFMEPKSRAGVASKSRSQVRAELPSAGAERWMARGARATMMAVHLSGVVFRRKWKPPQLKPWKDLRRSDAAAAAASEGGRGSA
jgi:hypothetical protein